MGEEFTIDGESLTTEEVPAVLSGVGPEPSNTMTDDFRHHRFKSESVPAARLGKQAPVPDDRARARARTVVAAANRRIFEHSLRTVLRGLMTIADRERAFAIVRQWVDEAEQSWRR